jgi:hypothetical protein
LMGVGKIFINGKLFSLKENTRFVANVCAWFLVTSNILWLNA